MSNTEVNVFEQAATLALRIPTVRGDIMVEQLYRMPLTSRDGFDLDTTAKAVNAELKNSSEESFVGKSTKASKLHQLRLDLIKHVIAVKLTAASEATRRVENAQKRAVLVDALAKKQAGAVDAMSAEDIAAELAKLDTPEEE